MLINGQRVNDPQTAHHNSDIPITQADISAVEVFPGANSSLLGPDAIGGAINFQLKKPEEKKRVLEFSFEGHNSGSALFSITEKMHNLGVRLSVERQQSSGFRYDTDYKKLTSTFNSSLELPRGNMDLMFGYQQKAFGAYDFYTQAMGYPSKEWTRTYLLNSGLSWDQAGFLFKPSFLWRRHFDKFMLDKTFIRSSYLSHHRTDMFTPGIYAQKETKVLGKIGLGFEYSEEIINSTSLGKHSRYQKSVFVDDALNLFPKLSLGLSWRRDDFEAFHANYTGGLNAKYEFTEGKSFSFGIAKNIRVPSFTELYYNDPTTLGNDSLSTEESLNYQAGYELKNEKLNFSQAFFYRQEEDLIDWVKRTPSQAKWQVENITQADVLGLENRVKLTLNKYLDSELNYTYLNKSIKSQGYLYKYGQNFTNHLVSASFKIQLPFGEQSFIFSFKKKPNRRGWLLLDSYLSLRLPKNSQAFVKATNLFNVEYQEIEGIPQPGRWVEGGLRFDW